MRPMLPRNSSRSARALNDLRDSIRVHRARSHRSYYHMPPSKRKVAGKSNFRRRCMHGCRKQGSAQEAPAEPGRFLEIRCVRACGCGRRRESFASRALKSRRGTFALCLSVALCHGAVLSVYMYRDWICVPLTRRYTQHVLCITVSASASQCARSAQRGRLAPSRLALCRGSVSQSTF